MTNNKEIGMDTSDRLAILEQKIVNTKKELSGQIEAKIETKKALGVKMSTLTLSLNRIEHNLDRRKGFLKGVVYAVSASFALITFLITRFMP